MDDRLKEKLGNYFKNADRFCWGLMPREAPRQKNSYAWLKRKKGCPDFKEGPYGYVNTQLLEDPGIEWLMSNVVIPQVGELFSDEALKYLRRCWNEGCRVEMSELHKVGIRIEQPQDAWPLLPFIEVNTQYMYVDRWGELAGLWFEDIERSDLVPHK